MRRIALLTIAAGLIVSLWVAPARAAFFQTFVSGTGSDLNDCARITPCASFAGALANTNAGGEINCVDSPLQIGSFTITRSVTIDCTGVAANTVSAGIAITINLMGGDTLQTVRLRGFNIDGVGLGTRGILIIAARTVIIEDLAITGESLQGIADLRISGGLLLIKDSLIAKNAGAGIAIAATGGPYGATIENVRSFNNAYGLAVGKGNNVMVTKSVLSGNSVAGLEMDPGSQVVLDNSIVNFNPTGLQSSGSLTLTGSMISYNNIAISGASASFGDNKIFGNSSPGTAPTVGAASTDHSKQ